MSDKPPLTLFESLFSGSITNALRRAGDVDEMEHPGLKGLFREAFIEHVITPLLPTPYKVSTGVIVDFHGSQSNQADVIIWDDAIYPPLYTARGAGVFAIESVVATIEIKSTVTLDEIRSAYESAVVLATMHYIDAATQKPGRTKAPLNILFGFESDADKSELDRLHDAWNDTLQNRRLVLPSDNPGARRKRRTDESGPTVAHRLNEQELSLDGNEYLQGIIIPSKRSYTFGHREDRDGPATWHPYEPDETHRGVRTILAGLFNSLRGVSKARGRESYGPNIGHYLVK
jgi:hypothetical protein